MNSRRLLGSLWFLSWFELYLEIFRHHHVSTALVLHPASWIFPPAGGAHPGEWPRAVLACSTLAPIAYCIAASSHRLGQRLTPIADRAVHDHTFPFAPAAIAFGSGLIVVAVINQVLRHDPFTIDLTLREGNGGFILLGAMVAVLGAILPHRRQSYARRT